MSDLLTGFLEGLLGTNRLNALEQLGSFAAKVLLAMVVGVVAFVVAARVRDAIHRLFKRSKADYSLGQLLGRVGYFLVLFVGLLLVLQVLGVDATAIFATLGVVGLAISLALQDVLKSVFAGIYLLIERPFRPGETIKVRDFVGVVETIDLRTTTLRSDHEVVFIPNAILLAEVLVNRGCPAPAPEETPE
jgi:small conductance mechanosensitive channel